jgi:CO/xanthine dehydrogenase FAD-binding subunit
MKPAPFDLKTPSTLRGALDELAAAGEDGRALAGGQSLIPLLNFRMSQPEVLVDLGGIPELRYIDSDADGGLRIGAMTTQTTLLRSDLLRERHPVVTEAIGHVAHTPIRNRGTIGGSIAHADPSAELPAIALLVDAVMVATSVSGSREIPAAEFFLGPYMTALEEGELLTEVRLPPPVPGQGAAVYEMANRTGDFALAGAGAWVRPDGQGRVGSLKVVAFAATNSPTVLPGLDDRFAGRPLDDDLVRAVAAEYTTNISPVADLHGTADYRRHLVGVVVSRALQKAIERATD